MADKAILLKHFMIAQRLLEGQSYVMISLILYMLYKIRNGLMTANTDPSSSRQVKTISTLMLKKYNEEFVTRDENTVTYNHAIEGRYCHVKGIPNMVLVSMCLDQ